MQSLVLYGVYICLGHAEVLSLVSKFVWNISGNDDDDANDVMGTRVVAGEGNGPCKTL